MLCNCLNQYMSIMVLLRARRVAVLCECDVRLLGDSDSTRLLKMQNMIVFIDYIVTLFVETE